MKLVFLMPATFGGGIEVSIPLVAENIDSSRFSSIYVVGINSTKSGRIGESSDKVEFWGLGRRSGDPRSSIRSFMEFFSLINHDREEIIVVANGEVAEVFVLLARRKLKHIFVVEHTSIPWPKLKWIGYMVRKLLNRYSTHWVTVSLGSKKIWPGITRFVWIPNPLSFPDGNIENPKAMSGLTFLGRLVESKDPELVCQVAQNLDLRLDIFGTGLLEDLLKARYSNNHKIVFHGHVKNVWNKIKHSSILVVASKFEGDGRVIAEAVTRNHPILLLDTNDHRRFHLPDVHFFKSESELLLLIQRALLDGPGYLLPPQVVREELIAQRSIEIVAKDWDDLFRRVL